MAEGSEKDVEKTMKEHGGMITEAMAKIILEGKNITNSEAKAKKVNITEINSGRIADGVVVELDAKIYRIFNPITFEKSGRKHLRRVIVLEENDSTVNVTLWNKNAEMVDNILIERGDRVIAGNLRVRTGVNMHELSSQANTYFTRLSPAMTGISDFSRLHAGDRNVDVVGKVVSISQVRHFTTLKGTGGEVSDCEITDGIVQIRLTMWGTSSAIAARMHLGDYVKVEYANISGSESGIELNASDSSRVLISNSLKGRMIAK